MKIIELGKRQLGIKGITAVLTDDKKGETLLVGANGYIAKHFADGEDFELAIALTPKDGMFFTGIHIDETTNDVSELPREGNGYKRIVHFQTSSGRIVYPQRDSANIRLLAAGPDGEVAMWNVALVSQEGSVFLVYQTMFSAQAYIESDSIVLPHLRTAKKWQKLEPFIAERLADIQGLRLPDVGNYKPEAKQEKVDGIVKWYSLRQQMGCIHTCRGDARVSWKSIQTAREDALRYLLQGEVVTYDLVPPRRKVGGRETAFDWEAINVRVVH